MFSSNFWHSRVLHSISQPRVPLWSRWTLIAIVGEISIGYIERSGRERKNLSREIVRCVSRKQSIGSSDVLHSRLMHANARFGHNRYKRLALCFCAFKCVSPSSSARVFFFSLSFPVPELTLRERRVSERRIYGVRDVSWWLHREARDFNWDLTRSWRDSFLSECDLRGCVKKWGRVFWDENGDFMMRKEFGFV